MSAFMILAAVVGAVATPVPTPPATPTPVVETAPGPEDAPPAHVQYGEWEPWRLDCESAIADRKRTVWIHDWVWNPDRSDWDLIGEPMPTVEAETRATLPEECPAPSPTPVPVETPMPAPAPAPVETTAVPQTPQPPEAPAHQSAAPASEQSAPAAPDILAETGNDIPPAVPIAAVSLIAVGWFLTRGVRRA